MSANHKLLTKVTEFETRDVLIRDLEILPDLLQTRAKTDPEVCRQYSKWMADGSKFPPVVVFSTPDDRLLLADGHHRVQARKSLGKRNIEATIRPGTMEDAVLHSIDANTAQGKINELGPDDFHHAAEIMIRNETFRVWGDTAIGKRCSLGVSSVKRIRLRLLQTEGIPLPVKVISRVKKHGKIVMTAYRRNRDTPPITKNNDTQSQVRVCGKRYLFHNQTESAIREQVDAILDLKAAHSRRLSDVGVFSSWLLSRKIITDPHPSSSKMGAMRFGNTIVFRVPDITTSALYEMIGRATVSKHIFPVSLSILVGPSAAPNSSTSYVINQARELGIEFMTPDELVVTLGGTPLADDDADDVDSPTEDENDEPEAR